MTNVPLCFVDTETTGLHQDRRPWEVALIRRDPGESDAEYVFEVTDVDCANAELIGLRIGRFHERHSRYRDQGVEGFRPDPFTINRLTEAEAAREVERATRGAIMVGLVPSFDMETLAAMLRRHGCCPGWHYQPCDAETLAVGWLWAMRSRGARVALDLIAPPWDSEGLSRAIGVEPPDEGERHTALGDARWAMWMYDAIAGAGDG